ncbi:hypothetical protein SDC9_169749 [bioreactor metagenome]|uniref:Uncharacterized protein n=1 Tax=bioreactor metagenome TaxID=1076179 RepID=A0A645G8A9_9ZZZZ
MCYPLLFPEARQAENAAPHIVAHGIVHSDLHVVFHGEIREQADILKGAGDARPIHLDGAHTVGILAVQ